MFSDKKEIVINDIIFFEKRFDAQLYECHSHLDRLDDTSGKRIGQTLEQGSKEHSSTIKRCHIEQCKMIALLCLCVTRNIHNLSVQASCIFLSRLPSTKLCRQYSARSAAQCAGYLNFRQTISLWVSQLSLRMSYPHSPPYGCRVSDSISR